MALTDPLIASAHGIALWGLYALKNGYRTETLTGTRTLTDADPVICGLDPDGAKTVVLDGVATAIYDDAIHGLMRCIVNRAGGAEDITVDDATGANIGTISQNEMAGLWSQSSRSLWHRLTRRFAVGGSRCRTAKRYTASESPFRMFCSAK